MRKNKKAFSLAEMMIVMLVLTIILAATMPILSKRAKYKPTLAPSSGAGQPLYHYGGTSYSSGNCASEGSKGTLGGVNTTVSGTCYVNYPSPCPTGNGWADGGVDYYTPGTSAQFKRTCYNSSKTCSVIYYYGGTSYASGNCASEGSKGTMGGINKTISGTCYVNYPPPCPDNTWTDGGVDYYAPGNANQFMRACYKCD